MRSTLAVMLALSSFALSSPLSAQSAAAPSTPEASLPDDLEALAARVDATHRPDRPIAPVTQFRAALDFYLEAADAKQGGQIDLVVRYMRYQPQGQKRAFHLMRTVVERAGQPIERGRDRDGYWHLVQGAAQSITKKDVTDREACRRDSHLAQQLVRFLDPGAVLRSLQSPTAVTIETLRFGREKGVECQTVAGRLPTFPLLRLEGDGAEVEIKVYVDRQKGQLLAVRACPIVDGKPDTAQAERIRLRDPIESHGMLYPKRIDHQFRAADGQFKQQSKVLVTDLDLRPEFVLQDLERPKTKR